MAFKWNCPYCNHDTTIGGDNSRTSYSDQTIFNKNGYKRLEVIWIVCPNPECQETTLTTILKITCYI